MNLLAASPKSPSLWRSRASSTGAFLTLASAVVLPFVCFAQPILTSTAADLSIIVTAPLTRILVSSQPDGYHAYVSAVHVAWQDLPERGNLETSKLSKPLAEEPCLCMFASSNFYDIARVLLRCMTVFVFVGGCGLFWLRRRRALRRGPISFWFVAKGAAVVSHLTMLVYLTGTFFINNTGGMLSGL